MLKKRVDECIRKGHNVIMMGDFNTPLNDRENQPKNVATERLLQWEETGDIRIIIMFIDSKTVHKHESFNASLMSTVLK